MELLVIAAAVAWVIGELAIKPKSPPMKSQYRAWLEATQLQEQQERLARQ
jgi:hypothetical protein